MAHEYLADLKLRVPETIDADLLDSFLEQGESELRAARNYLDDDETEARWKFVIIELALFHLNQQGIEGERQHSEGGISRTYNSVQDILRGVSSIARSFE